MIRAQTPAEIRRGLHHAAQVCLEAGRICWSALDVCVSDGCHDAASRLIDAADEFEASSYASTPEHACYFLLLAAEAQGNL